MSGMFNAIDTARNMLADCYWWRRIQSEVSPFTREQALARIYIDALPPSATGADHSLQELDALRPFALIFQDPSLGYEVESQESGPCCAVARGLIIIQIEYAVPDLLRTNDSEAGADCYLKMGRILRTCDDTRPGLWDLSGLENRLFLRKCTVHGLVRTPKKDIHELGDAFSSEIAMYWGLE